MSTTGRAVRHTRVSVIIPVRNEAAAIGHVVRSVLAEVPENVGAEVLVADDGSTDGTPAAAERAGARVLRAPAAPDAGGNPAAARNRAAAAASGDVLVFLDADCRPAPGWLDAHLQAHGRGETVVGGSLDLPEGLSWTARCDFYCGWYLVHPGRPAGAVPHHPPPNLSVRREAFLDTSGFLEAPPFSYTNEERLWQAELKAAGHRIFFEPRARAYHRNRSGLLNLLRRNYRWAYTALPAKAQTGTTRLAGLYRRPALLLPLGVPLAVAQAAYILGAWARAGVYEPLWMAPWVLASRLAYAAGFTVGGWRWLRHGKGELPPSSRTEAAGRGTGATRSAGANTPANP